MERRELENLVARGEGQQLEFKKRTPEPKRLAKEVIALANSGSGKILLGVDDSGAILGVKDSYEEEYAIREALEAWCFPPVRWNLRRVSVSRKREVLVISIPTRRNGPHYLRNDPASSEGVVYIRFRDESIEASPEAVMLMEAETRFEDVHFEFGKHELELMRVLDERGSVTCRSFAKRVNISIERARTVLVTMVRARVLKHSITRQEDRFTHRGDNSD